MCITSLSRLMNLATKSFAAEQNHPTHKHSMKLRQPVHSQIENLAKPLVAAADNLRAPQEASYWIVSNPETVFGSSGEGRLVSETDFPFFSNSISTCSAKKRRVSSAKK